MRIVAYLVIVVVSIVMLTYIFFDVGNRHLVRLSSAIFWITLILMWVKRKEKRKNL